MHRLSAAVRCMGLKGLPVSVVHITKDRLARNAERSPWLRRWDRVGPGQTSEESERGPGTSTPAGYFRPGRWKCDAGAAARSP